MNELTKKQIVQYDMDDIHIGKQRILRGRYTYDTDLAGYTMDAHIALFASSGFRVAALDLQDSGVSGTYIVVMEYSRVG